MARQESKPDQQVPLEGCDRLGDVLVRGTALRRVIENLLENAFQYGGGESEVRIQCCQRPSEIVIRVLDRGPGIPEEYREAVLRPFFRLEHSRNEDTGGSGLGLAICRQLAEANGWEIGLSPRPGGGTEARLVIPREPGGSSPVRA